jgi:hypothetical protein
VTTRESFFREFFLWFDGSRAYGRLEVICERTGGGVDIRFTSCLREVDGGRGQYIRRESLEINVG